MDEQLKFNGGLLFISAEQRAQLMADPDWVSLPSVTLGEFGEAVGRHGLHHRSGVTVVTHAEWATPKMNRQMRRKMGVK